MNYTRGFRFFVRYGKTRLSSREMIFCRNLHFAFTIEEQNEELHTK